MKHQNISLSIFLTAAIGLGSTAITFAQKQDTTINKQVEVVKAYRPSVSDAYKISPMPEIDDTTHFRPQFDYHIDSEPVTTGFKTVPVSAATINLHESTENGYGYLKLGWELTILLTENSSSISPKARTPFSESITATFLQPVV